MNRDLLHKVSAEHMRTDLNFICGNPLPYRKANYTRPGQNIDTLAEADAFIRNRLESAGCEVTETRHEVQAFRCDSSKPIHHWYSSPEPDDPFFAVSNIETCLPGSDRPDEIIQLISHKDSMSWIDSPGAHDNATGTVANIELARILSDYNLCRSVRFLFCNEEHTPWTSRFAAEAAAGRGDNIIAVLNVDSLDGKSDEQADAGKMSHVVGYSTDEGKALAEFVASRADRYGIDLEIELVFKEHINDDDGMFINAGFRTTVMNVGSWPYADSQYHLPGDIADRVNFENLVRSTQLLLAAIVDIDENGFVAGEKSSPA